MTQIKQSIGPRIAESRKAAGLTQAALGERTGNSARTIQSWELGTRHPRFDALIVLAAVLGCDVSWFYEASDKAAAMTVEAA